MAKKQKEVRIGKLDAATKAAQKDPWKNPRDPRPKGSSTNARAYLRKK
jgi:hypothetical protein